MRTFLAIATTIGLTATAHAQPSCPTPDELNLPVQSFADVFKPDGAKASKGEFETTADFEARKATVQSPGVALIALEPVPTPFQYDADKQEFRVSHWTFDGNVLYWGLRGITAEQRTLFGSAGDDPIELGVSNVRKSTGSYEAQNAYGAKTTVEKVHRDIAVIFQDKGRSMATGDTLFGSYGSVQTRYLTFKAPLADAPGLKSELRLVALVNPKPPYFAAGTYVSDPSRQFPTERTDEVSILFADIKCVAAIDKAGKVWGHWATR